MIEEISLDLIHPPRLQPRLELTEESILELAKSIDRHGLISPLTVIEENGAFRLLAGNRRLHALRYLGKTHADCNVLTLNPALENEITIAENLFRLNLSPVEEAYAFAVHLDHSGQSHNELAQQLGKERTYVTRRLLLLDLDDITLGALEEKVINLSQALLLRSIEDPTIRQKFIQHAVDYGSNVRIMHMWVTNYKKEQARAAANGNHQVDPTTFEPTREVFMACDRCAEPTSYDVLRPVYLCPSCRPVIASHQAQAILNKE